MSGPRIAGEGRKADAVAHLAVARSQNTENGIPGKLPMMRGSCVSSCPFTFRESAEGNGAARISLKLCKIMVNYILTRICGDIL